MHGGQTTDTQTFGSLVNGSSRSPFSKQQLLNGERLTRVGGAANTRDDANEGDSGSFPLLCKLQTRETTLVCWQPGSGSVSGDDQL